MKENKIRNKIITLSGQPVTGKSSTVEALINRLKNAGLKEENIHILSTGKEFRHLSELVVDFIKNSGDPEKSAELAQTEEMKMIFYNPEYRRAFIDSLVGIKSEQVDISHFTIEQANNLEQFEPIRKVIDTLIDENIKRKGEEINQKERPEEIWIVDSRLAFHNIPDAFSVRLTANPEVAGQRLFNDKKRGNEDQYETLEEAKIAREHRRVAEQQRYLKRYGVDLEDENNYNLIIDNSYSTIDDTAEVILQCLDRYMQDKPFAKKWTSPKTLLPLQQERETLVGIDDTIDSISQFGYIPSQAIEVVEVDQKKYIIEGHHRNFASAYLGKTLVPYEILAKDDELIPKYPGTARQRAQSLRRRELLGHEAIIAQKEPDFSYKTIYPEIYDKVIKRESDIER